MPLKPYDMAHKDLCDRVRRIQWMKNFTEGQQNKFACYLKVFEVTAGEMVCEEGQEDNFMVIILEGSFEVYKINMGTRTKLGALHASHTFGELAMFDGSPRSANVVAVTDAKIATIELSDFYKLAEDDFKIAFDIIANVVGEIGNKFRKVNDILTISLSLQQK